MKRLLVTAALVCGLVLAAVAAPALSQRPFRAAPQAFSLTPGAGTLLGDPARRGPGVVSRPLRAGKRFNLVGLSWARASDEPAIAVRTRTDGGGWSRWSPLYAETEDGPDPGSREPRARGSSNPDWVGEADWVQYRSSRPLRGLRMHFLNVRGTATASDRALTAVRRSANTAVASVSGLARGLVAGAAEPRPGMVSRADWGASSCRPRTSPEYGEVHGAFIHHTVNANDYSRDEARDMVLGICLYHRNTNGWNDIGYNFLVDRYGTIYEGRAGGTDQPVIGAQAQGYNAQSTGIANLGTFSSVGQSPEALRAMARLIRWKLPLHGVPTTGSVTMVSAGGDTNRYSSGTRVRLPRVAGHRNADLTECPGDGLYGQLPELRRMVGSVSPGGIGTRVRARVTARRGVVSYGRATSVSGGLATADGGAPLRGRAVEVQVRSGSRWKHAADARTDSRGRFSARVRPRLTRTLRVRYAGEGDLRSSTSPSFRVAVRPLLSLGRPPARAPSGARVVLRGRVRPRKGRVYQVLQIRRGRGYRTVGVRALRPRRDGRFRGSFVPRDSGLFRVYVVARGDRSTARAVSRRFTLRAMGSRGGGALAP